MSVLPVRDPRLERKKAPVSRGFQVNGSYVVRVVVLERFQDRITIDLGA